MSTFMNFIKKYPAITYYILVFLISWGGMLLLIAPGGIPGNSAVVQKLFFPVLLIMFAGPSLSGIIMTGLVLGRKGYSELISRMMRWRVGISWWAIALLTGPVLVAAILFGLSLFSSDYLPGLVTADDKLSLLIFGIAWGLIGGGLLEELGWTGFVVPTLRQNYSIIKTGLVVGVLWGIWHFLIAVWASTTLSGLGSVLIFIFGFMIFYLFSLPAYRILMVWVYDRTGSLLVAMSMHAVLSASTLILQPIATGTPYFIWNIVLALALWLIVALVGRFNWHKN